MTQDTSEKANERTEADNVRKLFSRLPFDQKICTLLRIELDLVGEAVESVASGVSKLVDEIVDTCAGSASPTTSGEQPSAG